MRSNHVQAIKASGKDQSPSDRGNALERIAIHHHYYYTHYYYT